MVTCRRLQDHLFNGSNVEIIGWDTCTYKEATSIQPSINSSSSAVLTGSENGSGAIQNAPAGVVVTRLSPGQYNVFKARGWSPTINGSTPSVTCLDALGVQNLDFCKKLGNTTFAVGFRKDSVSAYVDTAFCFSVARCQ